MRTDVAEEQAPGVPNLGGCIVHMKLPKRKGRYPPRCGVCGYFAERFCDWKKELHALGEPPTCDRPLCVHCAWRPMPEKDLCPLHALRYKAWLSGRTNSTDGRGP